MPWETFLFGKGHIDGFPTEVKVPQICLSKEANVREVVHKHFEDYGWCSIEKMKADLKKNSTEWCKLAPTWWLTEKFLNDHVDEMLEMHLKECLVNCLPNTNDSRNMSKALGACRALTNGPVVMTARKSTERELSGATNLLQDMVDARSPSCRDLANMSEFAVTFIKRCENVCIFAPSPDTDNALGLQRKTFGKDAMNLRYKWCLENESQIQPDELKHFRTFNWLLDEAQAQKVLEWQAKALLQTRSRIMGAHNGKAIEDDKSVSGSTLLSARASSSKDGPCRKTKNLP